MKLKSKVTALERSSTASAKLCSVTYKANQGPEGAQLPLEKALAEAKTGKVKRIDFPLTFNEEQRERLNTKNQLASRITEVIEGIRRDDGSQGDPHRDGSLILCSKPVVFARQIAKGGRYNGYLETEDGTIFHQSEWRDILTKYNAGFIIVRDYDDSREPWHKERN